MDPLNGLSVVEVAGRYSGRVAGFLLAALGAEVERLTILGVAEPDDHPLVAPDGTASAAVLDRRKRVHTVPPGEERDALAGLLARADVLLTSGDNRDDPDPIGTRRWNSSFGGVQVDISPYGTIGPCRGWKGADLTLGAHAGLAAYVGTPDREPLVPPIQPVSFQAGLAAAVAALAGLHGAPATIEVAEFDVMATTHLAGLYSMAFFHGGVPRRAGRRKPAPYPFTHLPCADGWVCLTFLEGRQWVRLVEAMGNPDWAANPRYRDRRTMGERYPDEVDALLIPWLKTHTKQELLALALQAQIPIAPLRTVDDLLASEQFRARGFLEQTTNVGGATAMAPTLPFLMNSGAPSRQPVRADVAGLRVLDLGRVVSAPAVGQWLADLGAEVVKVESRTHLDSARKGRSLLTSGEGVSDEGQTPNVMPYFLALNRGKHSITLDLASEAGREVLEALVARSDVLIENFGAGGLERFGLGPDLLHAVKPDLVVLRISAAGQDGPEAAMPGYAPQSTAAAGLDSVCRYHESEPVGMIGTNFGDINAAAFGVLAVLAALRSDQGCTIDLSMLEANLMHLGPLLCSPRQQGESRGAGNRHDAYHRHGVYRCAGADEWLAVAARPGEEELALDRIVGGPAEEQLRRWAAQRGCADAAAELQSAGVAAAPVLGVEDLLFDAQVRDRDDVVDVPHPSLGVVPVHGVPFRSPLAAVRGPAPDLGQHILTLMTELGFSPERIRDLAAAGAFDTGPVLDTVS